MFGTHNALTVAHIAELARDKSKIEFQHLHGMGEDLYRLMKEEGFATCVYAPVGNHDVLLGYLVRRILENGANSSFVHRLLDPSVPVDELIRDPADEMRSVTPVRHPAIRLPKDIFAPSRPNAQGFELADPFVATLLLADITRQNAEIVLQNADISEVFQKSMQAFPAWMRQPVDDRARCLERLADLLEQNRAALMALLISEAKKTVPDALGEVREAGRFLPLLCLARPDRFCAHGFARPNGRA